MIPPSNSSPKRNSAIVRWLTSALVVTTLGTAVLWGQGQGEVKGPPAEPQARWWKGNLHTHSLWSDGDQYPELIADWYKNNGYHFLALSDHNTLSVGQRWIDPVKSKGGTNALEKYQQRLGSWVEIKPAVADESPLQVRLKPLPEFRHLFEEPDRFLVITSEEISDRFGKLPVHLCATNLRDVIPPQSGNSVLEVMQNNVRAVLEQRRQTGQPMFAHLNHPNFGWAVTAEDLAQVEGEQFFEVYNGHRGVRNEGDELHSSTERIWDIVLALRLGELGLGVMYGVATDDSHNYHKPQQVSVPGRGWVQVRAKRLTPEYIIDAMEQGDFYATSGVQLRDVQRKDNQLSIEMEPEAGVTYTTRFIGTLSTTDLTGTPVLDKDGNVLPVTHRYSADIGKVFKEVQGTKAEYKLQGNELYVRAVVVSSRVKADPYLAGEHETAWVQPLIAPSKTTPKE